MDPNDSCVTPDGLGEVTPNNVSNVHDDGDDRGSNDLHANAGLQLGEREAPRKARTKKLSFRDFVMKEVLTTENEKGVAGSRPHKSILKVRTDPQRSHDDHDKQPLSFVNKAYLGDEDEQAEDTTSNETTLTTISTTKTPARRVWSTDSGSGGRAGFADLVDFLMQRTGSFIDGRDTHPFGRDCSIEGILQSSRPKSHSKNSAFGKLVVWLMMFSILVGCALGVIYLSETYNDTQEAQARLAEQLANKTKAANSK
ncbi:uncharacterized protein LOC112562752 [Pomacea canaliculata]|uniref:uncharacterized protein LOC112562752 n=1 Tax=Pomacea canaliculata TaxID=400727 RepID=UPI000D731F16|nr:uncharacterized protein LOC112562752 [Pomacea canaliculata]XP_025092003.1 uncharacterized protein LOC112562752 [Pomacea canaliculata]XP_025092004.1 uncharacterized protein LOC112562752 [Pomacea canaliculata]XP_025092005.1 uncharacterized protein LOC112562752 [Pomacea canaliculata]XP_025092006.1 uncharacterized protein LOC112562752 [Pomacea canaliculata]XP_025092008.1 uncharacterized protein LOC112562752 [Pomacea canaliculata]